METTKRIPTNLGMIEVDINIYNTNKPIFVFLHGVFLDRSLWYGILKNLPNLNSVSVDMIAHGNSDNPLKTWDLNDCVQMLDYIIKHLKLKDVILVGHSWGGMTSLRYCANKPDQVKALILINTPMRELSDLQKLGFRSQLIPLLISKRLYAHFAAKALYSSKALTDHPEYESNIATNFLNRRVIDIWRVISAVLLNAKTSFQLYENIAIPSLVIVGDEDYVLTTYKESGPRRLNNDLKTVPGGHISPHEANKEVTLLIKDFIKTL